MDSIGRWEVRYLFKGSLSEWTFWTFSAWSNTPISSSFALNNMKKELILCKISFTRPNVYSKYSFRTAGRNKTEGKLIEDTVFFQPILFLTFTWNSCSISSQEIRYAGVSSQAGHYWAESQQNGQSEVAQSCPTLWDPVDCSPPGSSIHGIPQARILEWVAISFSRGSPQPRDRTQVSRIAGRRFNLWATREAHNGQTQD